MTEASTAGTGEQGTGEPQGAQGEQQGTTPPAPPADQNAQQNAQQGDQQGDASPWDDPAKAKAEIERLRRENGDARMNAKRAAADEARQELLQTLTAALDPEAASKGEQVTVEQVTEQLTAASSERDAARAEAAIVREAWAQGVDPAKLDYLSFVLGRNAEFASASPADADFAAKLSAAISQEVAKDSSLKPSGTVQSTSVEQHGGAGGASTITKAEFDAMSYGERVELFRTNRSEYDRLAAG